jgi:hypothetical protein
MKEQVNVKCTSQFYTSNKDWCTGLEFRSIKLWIGKWHVRYTKQWYLDFDKHIGGFATL